jgi:vacuolar-type H+-ATPase subunit H
VETEAQDIIQAARRNAANIIDEANVSADQIAEETAAKAKADADALLRSVEDDSKRAMIEIDKELEQEKQVVLSNARANQDKAIRLIIERLAG